jgi:nucleoside-triphosphatase THEP1
MTARILAVTGLRGSGKTTRAIELGRALSETGASVGGVVQPARFCAQSRGKSVEGYDLLDLATGERRPFARAAPRRGGGTERGEVTPESSSNYPELERLSGFEFDPEGWIWAGDRIRWAREHCEVLVVDEIGRLEAAGGGHLSALRDAVEQDRASRWILSVRSGIWTEIQERVGEFSVTVVLGSR